MFPRRRKRKSPAEPVAPQPRLWMWYHDVFGIGGGLYFFLGKDFNIDMTDEVFKAGLQEVCALESVHIVRGDATYIEVEWFVRDDPTAVRSAYNAIVSRVIGLLSQHFNWQGEFLVGKFDSMEDMQAFRLKAGLLDRWRFGSY